MRHESEAFVEESIVDKDPFYDRAFSTSENKRSLVGETVVSRGRVPSKSGDISAVKVETTLPSKDGEQVVFSRVTTTTGARSLSEIIGTVVSRFVVQRRARAYLRTQVKNQGK